jgi:hypothetical protein
MKPNHAAEGRLDDLDLATNDTDLEQLQRWWLRRRRKQKRTGDNADAHNSEADPATAVAVLSSAPKVNQENVSLNLTPWALSNGLSL